MSTVDLKVEFINYRDALGRFSKLENAPLPVVVEAATTTQAVAVKYLKQYAPRSRNTSGTSGAHMADKIKPESVRVSGTTATATVYLPPEAAFTLPPGTRPHIIRPRGRYPLRFYWTRIGQNVAFWQVHHPGHAVPEGSNWARIALNRTAIEARSELTRIGKIRLLT